ncbi:cell division protein ZapA [Aliidiomarina halalkaliphila]|uniref:Cell division protein ZapA n=1 Tax=Aliidiomarina halalkaliphila TaxID=2593535 RepID=A0A552WZ25_9GAMM|nr:cell division protein ZapA [Aliidiomarina halalkaliphila]TRW48080.1 cell division protein ZapA [Aliidiomarina halalkaliphila]
MSSNVVDIKILDRSYRVMCPDGQETALREAAKQLDERMVETRTSTKLTNMEQIAIMAALNLCHEWIQDRAVESKKIAALEDKVSLLQATIEKAIGDPRAAERQMADAGELELTEEDPNKHDQ